MLGRLQNEDHKTLTELTTAGGSMSQLLNDTKIYITAKGLNKQLSTAITDGSIGGSGGGGGGNAIWYAPGLFAPVQVEENNQNIYLFPAGGDARLVIFLKIPAGYTAGVQALNVISFYSPSASGTVAMKSITYLIRAGVDAVTSTANSYTSTNAALTNTLANMLRSVSLDLTNGSGQINSLSPSAGDILRIELYRNTDTDTADVRLIPGATQVKLS